MAEGACLLFAPRGEESLAKARGPALLKFPPCSDMCPVRQQTQQRQVGELGSWVTCLAPGLLLLPQGQDGKRASLKHTRCCPREAGRRCHAAEQVPRTLPGPRAGLRERRKPGL